MHSDWETYGSIKGLNQPFQHLEEAKGGGNKFNVVIVIGRVHTIEVFMLNSAAAFF